MILDAILLALAEIASTKKSGVAILPEMRIAQGNGVQISHPVTGYELWLSGNVDYAVIEYDDVRDYKGGSEYYTLSLHELLHGLLRPFARPWWIQRGRIHDCKRPPTPGRGQTPECPTEPSFPHPGSR